MASDHDIPKSYEDFYRQYYPVVRRISASWLRWRPDDVDDVAIEVMTRLWERDIIHTYDPSKAPRFRAYLYGAAQLYVRGKAEEIHRKGGHYPLVFDEPSPDGKGTVGEFFIPHRYENPGESVEYIETVRELRNQVAGYRDGTASKIPMLRFFDVLVAILEMYGELNEEAINHFQEIMPELSADSIRRRRTSVGKHLMAARKGAQK